MISVSVITPTIGRQSLRPMLQRLLCQMGQGDEVIVVGDGRQPAAEQIVRALGNHVVQYWESEPIRNYGNPQRNMAISQAKGDYLVFVDDDDMPNPRAIPVIKTIGVQFPRRPLMFKMMHCGSEIWRHAKVEQGNVSGQMFVAPNIKGRIGRWSGRYEADFDFITSTLQSYAEGQKALVWRHENICIQGYVGRQAGAREL